MAAMVVAGSGGNSPRTVASSAFPPPVLKTSRAPDAIPLDIATGATEAHPLVPLSYRMAKIVVLTLEVAKGVRVLAVPLTAHPPTEALLKRSRISSLGVPNPTTGGTKGGA